MSLDPLKKELESIDQELELAMAQLSETAQRVDEILADFSSDAPSTPRPRAEIIPLDVAAEPADNGDEE